MPSSSSSAPQQFLNYRYTNRTWHHDQLMLGIFSSSKSIFIHKRNSVTENVQLTLESYLRLAKFLLLSRGEYWSFKNTIFDIRWVYLSMERWVQTTRASSQITFFKYLLTVYRHLDLSQKQNKKNQIDWLFFEGCLTDIFFEILNKTPLVSLLIHLIQFIFSVPFPFSYSSECCLIQNSFCFCPE